MNGLLHRVLVCNELADHFLGTSVLPYGMKTLITCRDILQKDRNNTIHCQ